MADADPRTGPLAARLAAAVGADAVLDGADQRAFFGQDVYRVGPPPLAVVRPASLAALQAAVRLCAADGVAMVPRGGGASYTDGYLPNQGGHVLFDTSGLDSIEIDARNAIVTVGAGVTWAALRTRLAEEGLRTPFWGPFSGYAASVGGSVSQNSISHGGSAGISANSVLSMDVVLASGDLMTTSATTHSRHFGPDMTGLFTGDCGALGIKAAIRLPLLPQRTHAETLSFAFDSFAALHEGMRAAGLERLDDDHFAIDAALSQGQIARNDGFGSKLRIALQVFKNAKNPVSGVRQLIRMALAGEAAMTAAPYMDHLIVEGVDAADVRAKATKLRTVIGAHGREIANSVPAFVRAMPFAPLNNILGPNGERWVPLHGILSHGAAQRFNTALNAFYATRAAEMARLGIWTGEMFSLPDTTGLLYEIAIYWPDARAAYHNRVLDPAHLATVPVFPDNPEARAYVDELKRDLMALFAAHGSAHFQIGRAYGYLDRLNPAARALVLAVKRELDPHNLMNPGVLGL